jgi:PAS domain S-box-containing protein
MAEKSSKSLHAENQRLRTERDELRLRLDEAEQALEAIRTGQVESLIVDGPDGPRIFSLEGADHAYRVLVEAMKEGAATFGENGTILYCNARFAEMLGAPLENVIGSAMPRFLPVRSQKAFHALLRQAANAGESRGELDLHSQDGSPVPTLISVSVIQADTRYRYCLVATDLRAQKKTEEILAAERLAGSVLEQAADAIFVCDENGRIIRMSSSAANLCAANPMLMPLTQALPLELATAPAGGSQGDLLARAMAGEFLRAVPASLILSDGSRADLLASAVALRDPENRILGYVVTLVDVTEIRESEEAVRAANLKLAEADQRKNQFLAVLSHELRNPLAPIKNSLCILERAVPGGDQARRAQDVIDRQTDQLARLVDDLLDVTRITSNKIQLQRQRLELNELVLRTMDDYRSQFENGEIALELKPAAAPVYVHADWNRIAQVIGNLLQNAAKFTSRAGLTRVTVETDQAARLAVIRVTDTGVGMSPELLSRLFEPFSQADETLDRSKGGLGLGLALVKGLVELHGGSVAAHSEGLGKGAEFIVRLPLDLHGTAQPETPAQESEHRSLRVLIIEDNVDAANSLSEVLGLGHHQVAVAYNGPEGIAKAREFQPEIVLCDIGLPGMDGYQVARAFRADTRLREVYLVALTGYALPEDLQEAQQAGFHRHLAKPPSLDNLEALLAHVPLPDGKLKARSLQSS